MIKINEFIDDYIGKHQIGNSDDLISGYIKAYDLEYSNYENIKIQVEEFLLKRSNISFSKTTGKFVILDGIFNNPVISKIQSYESIITGRLIFNNDIQIKLERITQKDFEVFLNNFKFENIGLYKTSIYITCHFEGISISISINLRNFQIRTNFSPNFERIYPFLDFLVGRNDYILNKKGYLPLDSVLYLTFLKIKELLTSKWTDINFKIDTFDHLQ